MVSVPIRGLFNLTLKVAKTTYKVVEDIVSVPIRGLFNLTLVRELAIDILYQQSFRPHQGII